MEPTSATLPGMIAAAGWAMVPIVVCSVVGLGIFLRKVVELARAKVSRDVLLDDANLYAGVKAGDLEEVRQIAEADASALGDAMGFAAQVLVENPERAEEETVRFSERLVGELERGIPALAFIAQVAPMLGLLGTVIGMVDLFSAMESSGSQTDTSVLSSGIWKALLTTAAGLSVGIPALAGHAWLSARVERLRRYIEDGVGGIINGVPPRVRRGQ